MSRAARVLVLCACVLAAAPGCGHRGPLAPPLPHRPPPPRDVTWRQRGDQLEVAAAYDLTGLEGRRLRPPVRPVVLWLTPTPADEGASWEGPGREREFVKRAHAAQMPEFAAGKVGAAGQTRTDGAPVAQLAAGHLVIALALQDKSVRSALSPRLAFTPAAPALPPLTIFSAAGTEKGVRLSWSAPDDQRVHSVHIYRFLDGAAPSWQPWRVVPAEAGATVDEGAAYGERLVYEATTADGDPTVPVESAVRRAEVSYSDTFPPAPPLDLDAVAETGRIRVLWRPGGSPDETRAIVERQVEGVEPYERAGVVEAPDSYFVDDHVDAGRRYRYRIIAVDKAGNRTAPAGPTDWVSPRPKP